MMYCMSKIYTTGVVFMIFLSWVIAEVEDDKTLNLKIGFDLTQGENGAPSLRIRNFEELPSFRGTNLKEKQSKRLVRAETSSREESENDNSNEKIIHDTKVRESDASGGADTSGSDDDRRVSTKGISPDEFEPERAPYVHGRYKGSESE